MLRPEQISETLKLTREFTSLGYVLRPEPANEFQAGESEFTSLGYVLRPELWRQ